MTRLQWGVIASAVALFLVIYFGCDTRPENIEALETSRALAAESTDINTLLQEAKASLEGTASNEILALETELEGAFSDSARAQVLRSLSSQWYKSGHPSIAGYYAQQVAENEGTEASWSIAGTTYTICIQRSEEPKIRDFCTGRAIQAFENAISINPGNIAHRVNLALAYTSNPPPDNPMKGVLMLRDLNQKDPDNVLVLNALARLALQTGQYARARERLESALQQAPENINTICLLSEAYEGLGETIKAQEFAQKCRSLQE